MGRIVLMGSGETAPAMVKTHRRVLEGSGHGAAVMLDTPYGFQVNADDLTSRTVKYFADSVGRDVQPARWRSRSESGHEQALAKVSQASWLFAGPGSPTYALEQWRDTAMPGAIADVIIRDGTVTLGSAAAVTAGRWALPVYEIYKVGAEPRWAEGLDLLGEFVGMAVAVIPHYDNAEGGTYDTRYCYLGEERLALLEQELDDDAAVLGVDEHTAVIFDVSAKSVEVSGSGGLTVRRRGHTEVLPTGTSVSVDELAALVNGSSAPVSRSVAAESPDVDPDVTAGSAQQPSLDADVSTHRATFDKALVDGDVDGAVVAVLAMEESIQAWSADTFQSDAIDRARRELRAMVVRLGELARVGVADPATVVAPLVDALLAARQSARESKDYATGDLLRDVLVNAGVVVNDTPDGVSWTLQPPP
jgi:cyanophycinase-like exopeptidase